MAQPSINSASFLWKQTCLKCKTIPLHQRNLHTIASVSCVKQSSHQTLNRKIQTKESSNVSIRHLSSRRGTPSFPFDVTSTPEKSTNALKHNSCVFSIHSAINSHRFSTQHSSYQKLTSNIAQEEVKIRNEQLFPEVAVEHHSFKGLESEFPCVSNAKDSGPEPQYDKITKGFEVHRSGKPFYLSINQQVLPELEMAYETWGELNEDKSNAVLITGGLSASSHAKSSPKNAAPGWWEKFVGPGCAVDTNKFFVICPNNLGGCYGSSGPSSINMLTGKPYGTTFPIIGVKDMTTAIFSILDELGVKNLYGAVGSSLGGMLSLQAAVSFPERIGRIVSISSCAQAHPSSIAMRYLQRKCIMADPNWNHGHYYDGAYPKTGVMLAREIATMTYRSGPEWDQRFGRRWINSEEPPSLCPTFLIESYLEHQGEKFSTTYDPNTLLYISKAMDLFDLSDGHGSLIDALKRVICPVMVIGIQTDILFPIWQQRELSQALHDAGNEQVTFYELNSIYGHDTFLLDLNGVGAAVKGFLETKQTEIGWLTKHLQ